MKEWIVFSAIIVILLTSIVTFAHYGSRLCKVEGYHCIKVKKGQSWQSLWSDPHERDIVRRVNRINTPLYGGMTIAVPNNLENIGIKEVAPFSPRIQPLANRTIIISPNLLAWGAYGADGTLVKWGAISGGKDFCPDVQRSCRSKTGSFYIYEKRGPECVSTKFPVEEGGAPMPYCMFYFGGYALHGSPSVPGQHASHGCIRLFIEDARWLNREFIANNKTQIIVMPYQ